MIAGAPFFEERQHVNTQLTARHHNLGEHGGIYDCTTQSPEPGVQQHSLLHDNPQAAVLLLSYAFRINANGA